MCNIAMIGCRFLAARLTEDFDWFVGCMVTFKYEMQNAMFGWLDNRWCGYLMHIMVQLPLKKQFKVSAYNSGIQ